MKKNIKPSFRTCFGICLSFLLILSLFSACSSSLSEEEKTDFVLPQGKSYLCVTTGLSSRTACPSSLPDSVVYALSISYESSGTTKYLGSESVQSSQAFISMQGTTADEKRFVFCSPDEEANYTLTLYAFSSGTTSFTKDAAFACGSAVIKLEKGQRVYSENVAITLYVIPKSSGNGKVVLDIALDSDIQTTIKSCKITVTKDGEADNSNYGFSMTSADSKYILTVNSATSGVYLVRMQFYADENTQTPQTEILVNSGIQEVSVYSGLETNRWVINGELKETLTLTKYNLTQLFIKGDDNTDTTSKDGKLYFYTSANSLDGITASDDNDGSLYYPFKTLQAAINKISVAETTAPKNINYTIYADGTFDSCDTSSDSSALCMIYSGTDCTIADCTVTIKGFSSGSGTSQTAAKMIGGVTFCSDEKITFENVNVAGTINLSGSSSSSATGAGVLSLKGSTTASNIAFGESVSAGSFFINAQELTHTTNVATIFNVTSWATDGTSKILTYGSNEDVSLSTCLKFTINGTTTDGKSLCLVPNTSTDPNENKKYGVLSLEGVLVNAILKAPDDYTLTLTQSGENLTAGTANQTVTVTAKKGDDDVSLSADDITYTIYHNNTQIQTLEKNDAGAGAIPTTLVAGTYMVKAVVKIGDYYYDAEKSITLKEVTE